MSPIPKKRIVVSAGIVLFWAAMTGWLVRNEAFPQRFGRSVAGYRTLLHEAPAIADSWMRIAFKDRTIGYARYRLETREHDPTAQVLISHEVVLKMTVLGTSHEVHATAEASLDAWRQLQQFSLVLRAGPHVFRADGRRTGTTLFEVHLTGSAGASRLTLDIPDDVILYSPLQELMLKRLAPGEQLRLRTIDPFSMKPADLLVEAGSWESLVLSGQATNALALRVTSGRVSLRAWMDAGGRILREESPLGWILETCEPGQALAWMGSDGTESQADLMQDWGGLFERLRTEVSPRED